MAAPIESTPELAREASSHGSAVDEKGAHHIAPEDEVRDGEYKFDTVDVVSPKARSTSADILGTSARKGRIGTS